MAITSFDTLAVSRSLEQGGFTREQVEALSQNIRESFQLMAEDRQLSTKQDLANLKHDLEDKLEGLENRLESKIHRLENKMVEERITMIKWIMTGMLAQMALLVAILSYLK